MKRLLAYASLLFVSAETSTPLQRIRSASPSGTISVVLPNGQMVLADVGAEFFIDMSGSRPILRLAGSVPESSSEVVGERLSANGRVCTLSRPVIAGSVKLWLNGVRLAEGIDYTVAAREITFVDHYNAPTLSDGGSVILADYKTSGAVQLLH